MPRISRAVAAGLPHHITQRGNYRQSVFETDADRVLYLDWLKTYSAKYGMKIWAYCLMSNHVHFVAVPMESDAMARTLNTVHMRYAQHANRKKRTTGHLWQGRFFSCVLDERHLLAAMRYVENNPVRAGMVEKAGDYRWSSAASHIRKNEDPVISMDSPVIGSITDWAAYLEQRDDQLVKALRESAKNGRPCGDNNFVRKIEKLLGRQLVAFPRGRPRRPE
jgi:putative transposase